ncbi:MAG: hypothetical protein ACTSRP_05405 [Candidatus Helarchaeota archaeon]
MRTTTVLKTIVSVITALFLVLQLLLIGSAAFIKPEYEENWTPFGGPPPIGFSTNFNISNQGIFPVQNLMITLTIYNSSGTILEGVAGPETIPAFTKSVITIYLFPVLIGNITDGVYVINAKITGSFVLSLISFTVTLNYSTTFDFPP